MKYSIENNNIVLKCYQDFDLYLTLDCGQCFRFYEENKIVSGMVGEKLIKAEQKENGDVIFYDISEEEFKSIIIPYFDFETDYDALKRQFGTEETMKKAVENCGGIRILKQDSWEALCSFIISQNNNIKRIKGIVLRLCENFGEKKDGGYTFPSAEKLASLSREDLSELRAGFRDKYILDAAKKVSSGEVSFEKIRNSDYNTALEELMKIKGVGLKVANCVLLYGFYRTEAFPVDVWVKRVLERFYKNGFPEEFYKTRGIAQQFLFHYIRTLEI